MRALFLLSCGILLLQIGYVFNSYRCERYFSISSTWIDGEIEFETFCNSLSIDFRPEVATTVFEFEERSRDSSDAVASHGTYWLREAEIYPGYSHYQTRFDLVWTLVPTVALALILGVRSRKQRRMRESREAKLAAAE